MQAIVFISFFAIHTPIKFHSWIPRTRCSNVNLSIENRLYISSIILSEVATAHEACVRRQTQNACILFLKKEREKQQHFLQ